jgi:hypothetical protein
LPPPNEPVGQDRLEHASQDGEELAGDAAAANQ